MLVVGAEPRGERLRGRNHTALRPLRGALDRGRGQSHRGDSPPPSVATSAFSHAAPKALVRPAGNDDPAAKGPRRSQPGMPTSALNATPRRPCGRAAILHCSPTRRGRSTRTKRICSRLETPLLGPFGHRGHERSTVRPGWPSEVACCRSRQPPRPALHIPRPDGHFG